MGHNCILTGGKNQQVDQEKISDGNFHHHYGFNAEMKMSVVLSGPRVIQFGVYVIQMARCLSLIHI